MYICIYIFLYVYMHVYRCMYVCIYISRLDNPSLERELRQVHVAGGQHARGRQRRVKVEWRVAPRLCLCMYIYTHIIHTSIYMYVCICMYIYIYVCICICIYIYTYVRIYIHMTLGWPLTGARTEPSPRCRRPTHARASAARLN